MATNLYISSTGSDLNNGLSPSTPFRTAQKAFRTAYLGSGEYNLNFAPITQVAESSRNALVGVPNDGSAPIEEYTKFSSTLYAAPSSYRKLSYGSGVWSHLDYSDSVLATATSSEAYPWNIPIEAWSDGNANGIRTHAGTYGGVNFYELQQYFQTDSSDAFWFFQTEDFTLIVNPPNASNTSWGSDSNFVIGYFSGGSASFSHGTDETGPYYELVIDGSQYISYTSTIEPWNVDFGLSSAIIQDIPVFPAYNDWPSRIKVLGSSFDTSILGGIVSSVNNVVVDNYFILPPSSAGNWDIASTNCSLGSLFNSAGNDTSYTTSGISAGTIALTNAKCDRIYSIGGSGSNGGSGGVITLNNTIAGNIYAIGGGGSGMAGSGGIVSILSGSYASYIAANSGVSEFGNSFGDGGIINLNNCTAGSAEALINTSQYGNNGVVGTINLIGNVSPLPTSLKGNVVFTQYTPSGGGGDGGLLTQLLKLPFPVNIG